VVSQWRAALYSSFPSSASIPRLTGLLDDFEIAVSEKYRDEHNVTFPV
jgi:hypothetical protein